MHKPIRNYIITKINNILKNEDFVVTSNFGLAITNICSFKLLYLKVVLGKSSGIHFKFGSVTPSLREHQSEFRMSCTKFVPLVDYSFILLQWLFSVGEKMICGWSVVNDVAYLNTTERLLERLSETARNISQEIRLPGRVLTQNPSNMKQGSQLLDRDVRWRPRPANSFSK
jgi:hypothetical protein